MKKHKINLTEPTDMLSLSKLSILLMNSSTIKDLFTKCIPNAKGSEFQVHYRAIVYHCHLGRAEVIVTVPTVFYNFEQEVSSGSVDYHLNDMTTAAEQVKPLSLAMVNQLHGISNYLDSKFDRVEVKLSSRPDIHAFILLNQLVPGKTDIIDGSEHDEIYLGVDVEELRKAATRDQLIDLCRCGIRFNDDYDCLAMFV